MRAQLAVISILLIMSSSMATASPGSILISAASEAEVISWAKSQFGSFSTKTFDAGKHRCFLLQRDAGSGTSRQVIYLYLAQKDQLSLIATRFTNTSVVTVDLSSDPDSISFKSKSGKTLMTLPISSLNLAYDGAEQ
jgi:hypothetical protein